MYTRNNCSHHTYIPPWIFTNWTLLCKPAPRSRDSTSPTPENPPPTLPFSHYLPKVTTVLTSKHWLVLPLFELQVNGIIQDILHWVWRLLPSVVLVTLICTAVWAYTLFLLIAVQCSMVWIYSNAFILFTADGHWGSFLFGGYSELCVCNAVRVLWWRHFCWVYV